MTWADSEDLLVLYKALEIFRKNNLPEKLFFPLLPTEPPDLESWQSALADGVMHICPRKPRVTQAQCNSLRRYYPISELFAVRWDTGAAVRGLQALKPHRFAKIWCRCLAGQCKPISVSQRQPAVYNSRDFLREVERIVLSRQKPPVAWRQGWETHRRICFGTEMCKANLLQSVWRGFAGRVVGYSV